MFSYHNMCAGNLPVWPLEPQAAPQSHPDGVVGQQHAATCHPHVTSIPRLPHQLGGLSAASLSEWVLPDSQQDLKERQMTEQMVDD